MRRHSRKNGNGSNGGNGKGNGKKLKDTDKALEIWEKLNYSINKIIDKIIGFNSHNTRDDYMNEAYIACVDAVKKYNTDIKDDSAAYINNLSHIKQNSSYLEYKKIEDVMIEDDSSQDKFFKKYSIIEIGQEVDSVSLEFPRSQMAIDVFAFWFIKKRLYQLADQDEVVFNIYNSDGEYLKTISNTEYRKEKVELGLKRCSAESINLHKQLVVQDNNGDESDGHCEFMDSSFLGFSPEITELLTDDIKKYRMRLR